MLIDILKHVIIIRSTLCVSNISDENIHRIKQEGTNSQNKILVTIKSFLHIFCEFAIQISLYVSLYM